MSVEADLRSASFTDFTLLSRTTDYGQTWTPARIINRSINKSTGQNNQTIGNVIVIDPRTGTLYDVFDQIFATGTKGGGKPNGRHGFNVAYQKSVDGGDNWSQPQLTAPLLSVGVTDPNNVDPTNSKRAAPLRTGDILPMAAVSGTGDLYAVWQDSHFSGRDEIAISTSGDVGATWTLPKRVNTPNGQSAVTAAVAVSSDGTIGVSYYQLDPTSLGSMPTRYVLKTFSRSKLLATRIDTGVSETPVAGPFNMLDTPSAAGYFTGDYEALVSSGGNFLSVFVQGACGASLDCRALQSVEPPADTRPTGHNSTDVYAGIGF
jgi:hypothetical protein